ncbi:hypothetical protein [Nonomuraea jiangxiensis]|nr:hypothetical protein [Nonomuraea jiangxiensis]
MRVRHHFLAALLLGLAGLASCVDAQKPSTYEEAARHLEADAHTLLNLAGATFPGTTRSDRSACRPGQVRHLFSAEIQAADASAVLVSELQAMGYTQVADDPDLRDEERELAVLWNANTHHTFVLAVPAGEGSTVRITGRTDCYAPGGT